MEPIIDEHMDRRAAKAEQRQRALELRKMGVSYRAIGKAMGYSGQQAWKDVQYALAQLATKDLQKVDEQRQLDLERMDTILSSLAQRVRRGDTVAIDRWLKVFEMRRKLLKFERAGASPQLEIKFIDAGVKIDEDNTQNTV